jgi:hypothetical protein
MQWFLSILVRVSLHMARGDLICSIAIQRLWSWLDDGGALLTHITDRVPDDITPRYLFIFSFIRYLILCLNSGIQTSNVPVAKGTTVIYIPHQLLLTMEVALASVIGKNFGRCYLCDFWLYGNVLYSSYFRKPYCVGGVFAPGTPAQPDNWVTSWRYIGESSFWWPYISTLPTDYCHMPLFWNDTQLQWLQVQRTDLVLIYISIYTSFLYRDLSYWTNARHNWMNTYQIINVYTRLYHNYLMIIITRILAHL